MTDIKGSEGYGTIKDLFGKFKRFHFDIASKVPYGSVPRWIEFADNRVEDSLSRERTILGNIKDAYVLYAIGLLLGLVSMWYVWGIIGSIFLSGVLLVGLLAPRWLILIVPAIILFILAPALGLLLRSAIYQALCRLMGGRGSYSRTMSVLVYHGAASLILSSGLLLLYAIFIGFFLSPLSYAISIYAIYLTYRGLRHVHGFTQNQALIATIGGLLIEMALIMALALAFYIGLFAYQMYSIVGG